MCVYAHTRVLLLLVLANYTPGLLTSASGIGTRIIRSNLPGRSMASSKLFGRLVAATTSTPSG